MSSLHSMCAWGLRPLLPKVGLRTKVKGLKTKGFLTITAMNNFKATIKLETTWKIKIFEAMLQKQTAKPAFCIFGLEHVVYF